MSLAVCEVVSDENYVEGPQRIGGPWRVYITNLEARIQILSPPPPQLSVTDRSKAVLSLWFLNVACYVCMYMVFSNMVS